MLNIRIFGDCFSARNPTPAMHIDILSVYWIYPKTEKIIVKCQNRKTNNKKQKQLRLLRNGKFQGCGCNERCLMLSWRHYAGCGIVWTCNFPLQIKLTHICNYFSHLLIFWKKKTCNASHRLNLHASKNMKNEQTIPVAWQIGDKNLRAAVNSLFDFDDVTSFR